MEEPLRVLMPLAQGFEEIETLVPVDLLRRAGVTVTMAALGDGMHVTGRSGVTLHADALWADVAVGEADALVLPGGPGVKLMRADARVLEKAREMSRQGRLVAAICAAPLVLKEAGLLEGRRFTAHDSTWAELPEALGEERVVEDGDLLTSRGAGTALEFGLALVRRLCGAAAAEEVRRAIMA
jgi:4-methyl-5(b-hydroxyethyl)-thiazole monophosphate biosynthesis